MDRRWVVDERIDALYARAAQRLGDRAPSHREHDAKGSRETPLLRERPTGAAMDRRGERPRSARL